MLKTKKNIYILILVFLILFISFIVYRLFFSHGDILLSVEKGSNLKFDHENVKDIDLDKTSQILLTSKSDHSEFYFLIVNDHKLAQIITFGMDEESPLEWNYIKNISDKANLLVGKINPHYSGNIEIDGVHNDEIKKITFKEHVFFYVNKPLNLPIKIKMSDSKGKTVYSNF
ncbi:hypothetical protein ACFOQM_04420 [Paenibacillus sp. GCM10012307]|uniref:Uncharacterized protein n=1 Tax=Paenibacillus roseus TaxID=2798579 RepID=A0A934J2T5_9BACL|nr:hypothetical protein [Paenibacillus roseus]MBJ6360559.1 hypothetical protein [Paenibacillus roseus]